MAGVGDGIMVPPGDGAGVPDGVQVTVGDLGVAHSMPIMLPADVFPIVPEATGQTILVPVAT